MRQPKWSPKAAGDKSPLPLGANYERPLKLLDRLRTINQKDPAFVSWVLLRSKELAELLTINETTNQQAIRELIAKNLVEAYDIHEARVARQQIIAMWQASTATDGVGDEAQQP